MTTKLISSLVAIAALISMPHALAEEAFKIEFKQLRGSKPQPALIVQEADMTPVAQKQLDKILLEGGMLETGTFKQTPGMNMASAFYEIKMTMQGKTHNAEIDEVSAPAAYSKLVKFCLKYGHKPVQAATADTPATADEEKTTDAKPAKEAPKGEEKSESK